MKVFSKKVWLEYTLHLFLKHIDELDDSRIVKELEIILYSYKKWVRKCDNMPKEEMEKKYHVTDDWFVETKE